jgi:hypothetical protein
MSDGAPALVLSAAIQRTRRLRLGALTFGLYRRSSWPTPFVSQCEVRMLDQKSIQESRERYRPTRCQGCRARLSRP